MLNLHLPWVIQQSNNMSNQILVFVHSLVDLQHLDCRLLELSFVTLTSKLVGCHLGHYASITKKNPNL